MDLSAHVCKFVAACAKMQKLYTCYHDPVLIFSEENINSMPTFAADVVHLGAWGATASLE
jgi:hypothetical protein